MLLDALNLLRSLCLRLILVRHGVRFNREVRGTWRQRWHDFKIGMFDVVISKQKPKRAKQAVSC
jgi:hypothetical protein